MNRLALAGLILALGAGTAGLAAERGAKPPFIPADMVQQRDEAEAATVAHIFLESMAAGRANLLGNMGTDPFTFDGRVVEGRDAIVATWQQILGRKTRMLTSQGGARLDTFGYAEAIKRFGNPPKKLAHLNLKKCMFSAVSFRGRPGFLMILIEGKEKGEGWLVTGVTE